MYFDLNDYSVPHAYVQRALTVVADPRQVRVLDAAKVIATHPRSYDRGRQVELPEHIDALVEHKHKASAHRTTDRLVQAIPQSRELLRQAAERGEPLGCITRTLLDLLDRYGVAELEVAIRDALAREVLIRTRCGWHWNAGARNIIRPHPLALPCPITSSGAMSRSDRILWPVTIN